jgi:hypothetical protein
MCEFTGLEYGPLLPGQQRVFGESAIEIPHMFVVERPDQRERGDARGEVTPGGPLSLQNMVSEHVCSDPRSPRHER